jgi:hypothetical protein
VADRVLVAVRLSRGGLAKVDALAAERGVSRSEMLRRLLALGVVALEEAETRASSLALACNRA